MWVLLPPPHKLIVLVGLKCNLEHALNPWGAQQITEWNNNQENETLYKNHVSVPPSVENKKTNTRSFRALYFRENLKRAIREATAVWLIAMLYHTPSEASALSLKRRLYLSPSGRVELYKTRKGGGLVRDLEREKVRHTERQNHRNHSFIC